MATFKIGFLVDYLYAPNAPVTCLSRKLSSKGQFYSLYDPIQVLSKFVLPEPQGSPPKERKFVGLTPVALDIPREFRSPEFRSRSRAHIMLGAAMPLATIDEDHHPRFGENDIRSSADRETMVDSVAESLRMKSPA